VRPAIIVLALVLPQPACLDYPLLQDHPVVLHVPLGTIALVAPCLLFAVGANIHSRVQPHVANARLEDILPLALRPASPVSLATILQRVIRAA